MERTWLIALLVLWAVLLFGGFIFGKLDAMSTRRMPAWTRIASSLTLVVAAWSQYLFARDTAINAFALLIAGGMTLGLIGDLFMAQLLPMKKYVLGGISGFGLGHIAYITALIQLGNQLGLDAPATRWGVLL